MRNFIQQLGLVLVLFLLIRTFLVESFMISSGSMENTLLVGDFLVVNKVAFGAATPGKLPIIDIKLPRFRLPGYDNPGRGEIVVFEYPLDRSLDFVKRCVAESGDTVEMRDKAFYINGIAQVEPYAWHADPHMLRNENRLFNIRNFDWQYPYLTEAKKKESEEPYLPTRDNFGPLVVPQGKYFCLGDNRDQSSDSRFWGFVDREHIKGRPIVLYFSLDSRHRLPRFGRIGKIIQ